MNLLTFDVNGGGNNIYQRFFYPAGEMQVRIQPDKIAWVERADHIRLVANLRSANDLVELHHLVDAIRQIGKAKLHLIVPYLPYGRADRRFVEGDCFGLKVFGSLLVPLGLEKVVTLDVHSAPNALACLPNLVNVSPMPFIEQAILDWAEKNNTRKVVVLFPDEGSVTRYRLPETLWVRHEKIDVLELTCSKKRDPATGKLSGFAVPRAELFGKDATVLIIDDICDGGGTFLGIANELGDRAPRLGLYVTHGIFSRGLTDLNRAFQQIYTANSFVPREQGLTIIDSLQPLLAACRD